MDKEKKRESRENVKRRQRRFWNAAQLLVGPWIKRKFNFSHDGFEPADIEGPVLVLINHTCAYDPIFVGVAFKNKPLTFIASEHLMRTKWADLLNRYLSIIPHQKGARGSRTALVAMKRLKRGESIFLAPEGEQTWNGLPLPVMPYTGKLVKSSGATLVNYVLEGGYLSAPRWAHNTRKGAVYGHPAGVYSPDVLKKMTAEEVETLIAKDLAFDTWEWQRSREGGPVSFKCSKGGTADGLTRSVFSCPVCGALGKLKSGGDSIGCDCGFSVRMLDTGFFEDGAPFETVVDWEAADRKALAARIEKMKTLYNQNSETAGMTEMVGTTEIARLPELADPAEDDKATKINKAAEIAENDNSEVLFADDNVTLYLIEEGHKEEEAARGRLTLSYVKCSPKSGAAVSENASGGADGGHTSGDAGFLLGVGDHSFKLGEVSNMTMVLAGRVVFSDKNGYYELRSDKRSDTNLRKYVIAWGLVKE